MRGKEMRGSFCERVAEMNSKGQKRGGKGSRVKGVGA